MPEYSHIQTYVKCDESNYKEVIHKFATFLSVIGINNDYFRSELQWELADNGFMYTGGGASAEKVNLNGSLLHVRPYVVGLTPDVIPELLESWLELNILFWTEEITSDYITRELKMQYKPYIWSLMEQFKDNYQQAGIYFTSEFSDGIPWSAIVSQKYEELWSFDAAIIPKSWVDLYIKPNDHVFYSTYFEDELYLARKDVWIERPWRDYG
ncbi:hypothetical protein [Paenibacillus ihuae]|uniref:hypothetical protein n=1 Tax=Paenibacillus ihuae TaxID=1232431 RepID=UPI0006D596A9|nr:hypothetical protein [Paenibacillus ihuae]